VRRAPGFRCVLWGWVVAWAVAVYLPSAGIAFAGLSPPASIVGQGWHNLPRATFVVADWMSPGAKLALGALLAAFFWLGERSAPRPEARITLSIAAAIAAMLVDLALLPADLSRGFGIGLTGARFDWAVLPFYLAGAAIGGGLFVPLKDGCARRTRRT
jgi:hypothetical protein